MCILVCVKLFVEDIERWSYVNNAHLLKELERNQRQVVSI